MTNLSHRTAGELNRRSFSKVAATGLAAAGFSMSNLVYKALAQPTGPKADKIDNRLYFLSVDGSPYERGYQHGQALRYVIQRGVATWKQWISEFLEQPNPDVEIAEFVQGTDFMGAIRKHTPDL